jgi:hypothetical protein
MVAEPGPTHEVLSHDFRVSGISRDAPAYDHGHCQGADERRLLSVQETCAADN